MYYGNAGASTTSDGEDTFLFFDDMGGVYGDNWNDGYGAGGSFVNLNGIDTLRIGASSGVWDSSYTNFEMNGTNVSVKYNMYLSAAAGTIYGRFLWSYGKEYTANAQSPGNETCFKSDGGSDGGKDLFINEEQWYSLEVKSYKSNHSFYVNNTKASNFTYDSISGNPSNLNFRRVAGGTDTYIYVTNVTVRPFIDPEPTASIKSEEARESYDSPIIMLNATSYNNLSSDNLTCLNVSTGRIDAGTSSNIINWYKDGNPLNILNIPFDRDIIGGTLVKDYSDYSTNGTLGNNAVRNDSGCIVGTGCSEFDGNGDYIQIADNNWAGTGNVTITAWGYWHYGAAANYYLAYKNNKFRMYIGKVGAGGSLSCRFYDSLTAATTCTTGFGEDVAPLVWNQFACVYNETSITNYVNGTALISCDFNDLAAEAAEDFFIGAQGAGSNGWNGTIDEVKIYDIAMTGEELLAMYEYEFNNNQQYNVMQSLQTDAGEEWECSMMVTNITDDDNLAWSNNITIDANYSESCTTPAEDTNVNANTVFCGGTYALTDPGDDGAIRITGNNFELNCNGAIFIGDDSGGSRGISVTGYQNVTIKNCNFSDYDSSIYLSGTANISIRRSKIESSDEGIYFIGSSNLSVIRNNNFFDNDVSIELGGGHYNIIEMNNFTENKTSIYAYGSTNNTFRYNVFDNTYRGYQDEASAKDNNFIYNNLTRVSNPMLVRGLGHNISHNRYENIVGESIRFRNAHNLTFSFNYYYNHSRWQPLEIRDGSSYINIFNNTFYQNTRCVQIDNASNLYYYNNNCSQSINNFDWYNIGMSITDDRYRYYSPNQIKIENNTFENYGCLGLQVRGANNVTIIGNIFNQESKEWYMDRYVGCGYEPTAAIFINIVYRGFVPGTTAGDDYKLLNAHNSTNVTIGNNTFNANVQLPLRTQDISDGFYHDVTGYWFRSWQLPYLMGRDEFYISSAYSELTALSYQQSWYGTKPVVWSDIMEQGIYYNRTWNYSLSNTLSTFYNVNKHGTDYEIRLFNLTNSYGDYTGTYWDNGSLISSTLDQMNITVPFNRYVEVRSGEGIPAVTNETYEYESEVYETTQNLFVLNASYNDAVTSLSATLEYGGGFESISYTDPKSGLRRYTSDVYADSSGNINWEWLVTYNYLNGSSSVDNVSGIQIVNPIQWGICGPTPLTTEYLNISFKNETTNDWTAGRITSGTFTYGLESELTTTKAYVYTNTTDVLSHMFCFEPINQTVYVNLDLAYTSAVDTAKTYQENDLALTNTPTLRTLYLLSGTSGQDVSFQVNNISGGGIATVSFKAEKLINGTYEEVVSDSTDSDGEVIVFLDSNYTHRYTLTKAGYNTYTDTFKPILTAYTMVMTRIVEDEINYYQGISWDILPAGDLIINDTAYDFSFALTSSYHTLQEAGFVLFNSTTQLGISSCSAPGGCTSTTNVNTLSSDEITMKYYWVIGGNYTNGSKTWIVSDYSSQSSLALFLEDMESLSAAFGEGDRADFTRGLIAFFIIMFTVGTLTYISGIYSRTAILFEVFVMTWFMYLIGFIPEIGMFDGFIVVLVGLLFFADLIYEYTR